MKNMFCDYYESPIGLLEIVTNNLKVLEINFVNKKEENINQNNVTKQCIKELDEYFNGIRKKFDVKLELRGTDFQKNVWNELEKIEYGEVKTYKDIAININNEKAVRAVGNANNKNKIPIIIPCHRVIGASGKLVGYAGGLDKKQWLLNHENNNNYI